jgi:hypothetical protein
VSELQEQYGTSEQLMASELINNEFKDDFTDLDKQYFNDYNIKIYYIDENIYLDDTIETIKFKLLKYYNERNGFDETKKICFEELYLYGLTNTNFNSVEIYNLLSNNNTNKITQENFNNFLLNTNEQIYIRNKILERNDNKEKDIYDFDDIDSIDLDEINILISVGQHLNTKIPHICLTNPFEVNTYEVYMKSVINTSLTTNNNELLFESRLINRTLYVCILDDLMAYIHANSLKFEEELTIKLYFPLISISKINSYTEFIKVKKNYIKKSNEFIDSKNFINKNKLLNLFNKVNNSSTKSSESSESSESTKFPDLEYINKGIKYINFNIHSNINSNLSLESIFKVLNSTINIPLIKHNPGKRIENIYRLYCDKLSKGNKKIPFLSKDIIIKYSKIIGKKNTISMIVLNESDDFSNVKEFLMEIDNFGIINIKVLLKTHIAEDILNKLISDNINPILNKLVKFTATPNAIKPFISLLDIQNEIVSVDYNIQIDVKGNIKALNNIKDCLQYFFNIIDFNVKNKTLEMRYKRVSNYNEMSSIDAFIIELIKQKELPKIIIIRLIENFKIESQEKAIEIFETTVQNLNLVQNLLNYKRLKIRENPGFLCKIDNKSGNIYNINIENIDSIYYLIFINDYIDSIFKLAFSDNKLDAEYDVDFCKINKKNKDQLDQEYVEDIKPDDLNVDKNKANINNILNTEIEIDLDDNMDILSVSDDDEDDNILNLLLDDEDEDDDEDEYDITSDLEDQDEDQDQDQDLNLTSDKITNSVINKDVDSDAINNDLIDNNIQKNILINDEEDEEDEDEDEEDEDEDEEDEDEEEKKKETNIKTKQKKNTYIDNDDDDDDDALNSPIYKDTKKAFKESAKTNPLLQKLNKYEPELFSTKILKPNVAKLGTKQVSTINTSGTLIKEKQNALYETYSRVCQQKRQPIILNEDEKNQILIDNPNLKPADILKYSTDPEKKYYYICPKFWDLDKNKILTPEQVKSGDHGTLYNETTKTGNIYKLSDPDKLHKDMEPGFLDHKIKNKKGDEFCLPCCFYKLKSNLKNNKECNTEKKEKQADLKYIISENKFPLDQYKIGKLPINVKNFIQYNSDQCINENTLKYKHTCLLRYGVENNLNNSFIACIADAYSKEVLKISKTISIDEMKHTIIDALTVDNFITYNNGNLTQIFLSKKIDAAFYESIDLTKYNKDDLFYKNLNINNTHHLNLYKGVIDAFENFKIYLKSNDYIIDYTYLWDIVCKPNSQLFPNGINLIILDITSYDITDNIKVICPKQNYSAEFLDANKNNLILLKNENYFEPLYFVRSDLHDTITPLIPFENKNSEPKFKNFKHILNIIKENINKQCIGNYNEPDYEFNKNADTNTIINIMNKLKYEVAYQIINYENKTIGLVVTNSDNEYHYIPCYPSAMYDITSIPFKLMDDLSDDLNYYRDYHTTKDFLNKIYNESTNVIQCKPVYKIIDNGLIVGILTSGNQFVMINKPDIYIKDELKEMNSGNYLMNDTIIQTSHGIDEEREEMISNIKLESGFYNSFRNTIQKLLLNYKYIKNKISLQNLVNDNTMLYEDKIISLRQELEIIGEKHIVFALYDNDILKNIKNVTMCANNDNCDTDFCMSNKDTSICNLIIPQLNLITGDDNSDIYYSKLADEFARYNRAKMILLNTNSNFYMTNIKYNIAVDELIILESSLIKDLFDGKHNIKDPRVNYTPYDVYNKDDSKYSQGIMYNTLDLTPIQSDKKLKIKLPLKQLSKIKEYENKINALDEAVDKEEEDEKVNKEAIDEKVDNEEVDNVANEDIDYYKENANCRFNKRHTVREHRLKNSFKRHLYESYFDIDNEKSCSYELILFIIKHYYKHSIAHLEKNSESLTINDLKNDLINILKTHPHKESLLVFLSQYNKNSIFKPIVELINLIKLPKNKAPTHDKNTEINNLIESLINNNDYYLTYLDIYLLAKQYNIPIIFLSTTVINISVSENNFIISNQNIVNDMYYFIKVPSQYARDKIKNYKLLFLDNSIMINIRNDIQNSETAPFEEQIFNELKIYKDKINEAIEQYHNKKFIKPPDKLNKTKKVTDKPNKPNKPDKLNKTKKQSPPMI